MIAFVVFAVVVIVCFAITVILLHRLIGAKSPDERPTQPLPRELRPTQQRLRAARDRGEGLIVDGGVMSARMVREACTDIPSIAEHTARVSSEQCDCEPQQWCDHVPEYVANEPSTRERGWMQTFSGRRFYPLDPRAADIELADVAHGLAMTCRYGGQCKQFYSVAEHCVLVSEVVERHARNAGHKPDEVRRLAQLALMHDSAEAYIGDMIRPLKHQAEMSEFRRAEAAIEEQIAIAFALQWSPEAREIVKRIDDRILVDEVSHLMTDPSAYLETPLLCDLSPLGVEFYCWPPAAAQREFIARWKELFS